MGEGAGRGLKVKLWHVIIIYAVTLMIVWVPVIYVVEHFIKKYW